VCVVFIRAYMCDSETLFYWFHSALVSGLWEVDCRLPWCDTLHCFSPKRWQPLTGLGGVMSKKTTTDNFIDVRTWSLIHSFKERRILEVFVVVISTTEVIKSRTGWEDYHKWWVGFRKEATVMYLNVRLWSLHYVTDVNHEKTCSCGGRGVNLYLREASA
jgi:hypothetical protein